MTGVCLRRCGVGSISVVGDAVLPSLELCSSVVWKLRCEGIKKEEVISGFSPFTASRSFL